MPTGEQHPVTLILQRAIRTEEDSYALYTNAAWAAKTPHIRNLLQELAQEEAGHKQTLQEMVAGDPGLIVAAGREGKIEDLKIGDYLVAEPLRPDADMQDVLIVASHREKASYDFYSAMAGLTCSEEQRKLFLFLAEEELSHKNRVEAIYEQTILKDF